MYKSHWLYVTLWTTNRRKSKKPQWQKGNLPNYYCELKSHKIWKVRKQVRQHPNKQKDTNFLRYNILYYKGKQSPSYGQCGLWL